MGPFATHEVTNQGAPFEDVNLFTLDAALQDAVTREGGVGALAQLTAFGAKAGSREALEQGRLANEHVPTLHTHDPQGRRLDLVRFHPAWDWLMTTSKAEGLHASAFQHLDGTSQARGGAHVERAAAFFMATQMEAGHCCPITMTNAAIPVLASQPEIAAEWLPKILARQHDPRFLPHANKTGVTIGMAMTEKQGGTDVRANTTRAAPQAAATGPGAAYLLTGHKWFMSAPMSDAFLVLAHSPVGHSCFLVPRFKPDGAVNALRLMRLKNKLGNRSNASSEVEFEGAHGVMIGEEGRGVAAIIEMVSHTRLDCAIGSAGLMRLAVSAALHHCRQRHVFGRSLADQPIMAQVLADLAVETEAATALAFRLARSFDLAADPRASAWRRLMTPITKYWVCKTASAVIGEAMECMGGNGYIEDSLMPRLYREAPVNSIWEGSGNVMALDVLRVLQREPEAVDIVVEDLTQACGDDPHLKAALARVTQILHEPRVIEQRARALVEGLALVAAGTILRAHAPQGIADAFVAARMSGSPCRGYGQGLDWIDTTSILSRTLPV